MTDRCIRCGVVLPPDRSVCLGCNPAELPSPSATQYHATVFIATLGAIVVVAIVMLIRG